MRRSLMIFAALVGLTLHPLMSYAADTVAAEKVAAPAVAARVVAVPVKPSAFFVDLKDGATVTSPFKVKFGVKGLEIAPAGTDKPNTGHFHLLIDTELTAEQMKAAIPSDDKHLHFGKGQTESGDIKLAPGKHTLQIVIGDGKHMVANPPVMSDKITVTVK